MPSVWPAARSNRCGRATTGLSRIIFRKHFRPRGLQRLQAVAFTSCRSDRMFSSLEILESERTPSEFSRNISTGGLLSDTSVHKPRLESEGWPEAHYSLSQVFLTQASSRERAWRSSDQIQQFSHVGATDCVALRSEAGSHVIDVNFVF